MGRSSVIGLLAFALCLVVCLPASVNAVGEEDPKQAVERATQSIKEICQKAKSNINTARGALDKIKEFNERSEEAKSQAAQVLSQATAAAEANEEATAIIDNVKDSADTISRLHQSATENLQTPVSSLTQWLSETQTLKDKCDTELVVIESSPATYTDTSDNASYIKENAVKLDSQSTDVSTITGVVDSNAKNIKQSLTNAQLKNLHINVIVTVAKIENMMRDADSNIKKTEKKKNEVNDIVEEIEKHCRTPYADSNTVIKPMCDSAKEALTNATDALKKAKKAKEDIGQQEQPASTALKLFKENKALSKEQTEVTKAKKCVAKVKEIENQLKTALDTANNAVMNAKELQKNLLTALSTTTSEPSTEQTTETKQPDIPVGIGTGTDQKGATIQPTSNELPDQSNNSTTKLKDALSTGAQNVPATALIGGKAPAPGANNDSAMTVSVPLLVALIASAVLQ